MERKVGGREGRFALLPSDQNVHLPPLNPNFKLRVLCRCVATLSYLKYWIQQHEEDFHF